MDEILPWDCEVFLRWWGSEGEMLWRLDCKRAMERAKGEKASGRGFEKRRRFGSPRGMGLRWCCSCRQLLMFVVAGEEAGVLVPGGKRDSTRRRVFGWG